MINFMTYWCLISLLCSVRFVNCNANNQMLYEGESCTDLRTQTSGCCQLLRACSSAIQDLKSKKLPTICSYKKEVPVVCCKGSCPTKNITEKPYIWSRESDNNPPNRNNNPSRISERKCLEYTTHNQQSTINHNVARHRPDVKMETSTDGYHNLVIPPYDGNPIQAVEEIGGVDSILYEFPHMAALGWYTTNGSLIFSCGGSLISDKYVLTAGHCTSVSVGTLLNQSEPSIVRLGDLNIIDGIDDNASPIDIPIKRIIRHPEYKPPNKYNDIALLELGDKVEINRNVLPACLWTENDFGVYRIATSTGWGTTKLGGTENSPVLQKVDLDIINTTICDSLLSAFRNRHWQGVKDDQMCAGVLEGGKDSCQGDSGGPLQVLQERRYYIIGVTSFGKQCAKPNQPGIYVKVSHFIDWIESIVWPES